jgi:hypothetical protein
MVGYELHDFDTEENLGAVIILNENEGGSLEELTDGWVDFNVAVEHELNHTSVDDFVEWFNENHVTQIERLILGFIQFG